MELRPYQRAAVEAVYRYLRERDGNPVVVLPTGCHVKGHPILLHDGSVKAIERIEVGDVVMGPDSQPRTVLALCRGHGRLYEIRPRRGVPFVVNEDHVLSLVCTSPGKHGGSSCKGGDIDNISVKELLTKSASWRWLRKLRSVAVDFPPRPVGLFRDVKQYIDPYIAGILLGDGSLQHQIALHTIDHEMVNALARFACDIECDVAVRAKKQGTCPAYFRLIREMRTLA